MQASDEPQGTQPFFDGETYRPGERYRFSGRCGLSGILTIAAAGLVAAAVGSLAYAGLQAGITRLSTGGNSILGYLGYVGALGLGFLLTAALVKGARVGNVRGSVVVVGGSLIAGATALYLSWLFWVYFVSGEWVFGPLDLISVQVAGGEMGAANGFTMLLEAGILIGMPMTMGYSFWQQRLFCERCQMWTKGRVAGPFQPVEDVEAFRTAVASGTLRPSSLTPSEEFPSMSLRLDSCPECGKLHVVSATINVAPKTKKPRELIAIEKSVKRVVVTDATVTALEVIGTREKPSVVA